MLLDFYEGMKNGKGNHKGRSVGTAHGVQQRAVPFEARRDRGGRDALVRGKARLRREVDFWGIVGLLHDLDFEQFPEQHCIKSQEIMRERGLSERLIHATASHGYLLTVDIAPEHEMEKVLYAVDRA